jgi:deoxyribodipyrimidine photo-lyase
VTDRPILLWVRQDLRLSDNPALSAAVETGRPVIPVYILDDVSPGEWRMGGASRWWLGTSLAKLADALSRRGSRLVVRTGRAVDVLLALVRETGAGAVYFGRAYEPWAIELEMQLAAALEAEGASVRARRFAGRLMFEPEAVRTDSGTPFRVYSPFARATDRLGPPRRPLAAPESLAAPDEWPPSLAIGDLGLLPSSPDWAGGLRQSWTPGEAGARVRLADFVGGPVTRYKELRDRPDIAGTSRLSPHLHFGEVSAAACWHAARDAALSGAATEAGVEKFCRELLWREFSYHLLHQFPGLAAKPFRPEFAAFPWAPDNALLAAWQRGRTGYPIVDAGMRELWTTGYMHNRVRMIAASFLVKDLLVPWQEGARWFWDTLVDADLANNSASWQWVAGSGADAAPYFRIFNPVKQGLTFDPDGIYVRTHVPELACLPPPHIHAPFDAPASVLAAAGVELGKTYPLPVVDHQLARRRALAAFAQIKAA